MVLKKDLKQFPLLPSQVFLFFHFLLIIKDVIVQNWDKSENFQKSSLIMVHLVAKFMTVIAISALANNINF